MKIVLHVEETLKTTIQKKLPKYQKFEKKYLWLSFVIVKPFFSGTVILFYRNLDEKITSNEQKLTSIEQKVRSNEQKVKSNEQKVTSNKQKVTSNKQKVTSNKQKVTSNEQKVQPRLFVSVLN